MIRLDTRVGSGELLEYFRPYGVEVQAGKLSYGDAAWWGCGVDGPVLVGVERKNLADLVASMRSGRLSGFQLKGLLETYGWVYLLVEGIYRAGVHGEIEVAVGRGQWVAMRVGSKPVMYTEVDHYIATLEHRCGLSVVYTANPTQTVAFLVSRYKWWEKEWTKHDSHEAIYAPYEHALPGRRGVVTDKTLSDKELRVLKVAAQLPGVSRKAYEFSKKFKSVKELVEADEETLRSLDGVGKVGAHQIHKWLRGQD